MKPQKISGHINSTMFTVTWTLTKGIPPRVRSPKTKKKSALKHSGTKQVPPKKHKASQSDNDSSDETSSKSGDSNSKPKQKRKTAKCQHKEEPESDTETVDGAKPEPIVEEVEQNPMMRFIQNTILKCRTHAVIGGWA